MFEFQIAVFVTPHGFGHAARACAVISALATKLDSVCFQIFTNVPEWFFEDSLRCAFQYHSLLTDIGLVQNGPFNEDLPATVSALSAWLPFDFGMVENLSSKLNALNCRLVISDISPLGLSVARAAGIPSVLVENFTWDWIYKGYKDRFPAITPYIEQLKGVFETADYRVKATPFCSETPHDLVVQPISRIPENTRVDIRRSLNIPLMTKTALITMGGIPDQYRFLEKLSLFSGYHFIVPGVGDKRVEQPNVTLLPHHSDFYHPDLLQASDVVVGKVGYSTLAEVYTVGIPFGYIMRDGFPESYYLAEFIKREMTAVCVSSQEYQDGSWTDKIEDLFGLITEPMPRENGSESVGKYIKNLITLD